MTVLGLCERSNSSVFIHGVDSIKQLDVSTHVLCYCIAFTLVSLFK